MTQLDRLPPILLNYAVPSKVVQIKINKPVGISETVGDFQHMFKSGDECIWWAVERVQKGVTVCNLITATDPNVEY